jgi:hypothetical protein
MTFCAKVLLVGCIAIVSACVTEHNAVVSTAAIAEAPWTCAEAQTQVMEVGYARYRLTGCGTTAVYNCNFAFQPPRCWR